MTVSGQKLKEASLNTRLVELIVMMSDEEKRSLVKELEERLDIRKRRHDRKPYFTTVCYSTRDGAYTDFIHNIGAGGVFIGTNMPPSSVGQEITLAFPLPISQKHIMLSGEIAWVTELGMGVKFKTIGHEEEERIKRLVDMI